MELEPPSVCALVPMRHDSERVPGKNFRQLNGIPLFGHIVESLLAVDEITEVVIDTDSPVVRAYCDEHYPAVVVLERPPHLRDGHIPMTSIIQHDVRETNHAWYLQTHSTNPFLRSDSIRQALRLLSDDRDHDSLFTVTRLNARLYSEDGRPLNHDPAVLLRTQDLPPIFIENSCMYIFEREQGLSGRRLGDAPLMYELAGKEAHDIDTEDDWTLAEVLVTIGTGA